MKKIRSTFEAAVFFIIFASIPLQAHQRNIYYLTGVHEKLFTLKGGAANQDGWKLPYIALKEHFVKEGYGFFPSLPSKIDSNFYKELSCIFIHNIPSKRLIRNLGMKYLDKIIVIHTEPPHTYPRNYNRHLVKRFKHILTYNDNLVNGVKFKKYHFPISSLQMIKDRPSFKNKKLCTLINSNKLFPGKNELYSERKRFINYFKENHPDDFELYGFGWNTNEFPFYKGAPDSKTEVLKNFKFSISYENIKELPGYISEKIFGSFVAGCVPIYFGAPNIESYIPKSCFVDARDFKSFDEIYAYIFEMSEDRYNEYINAIQDFLSSPQAAKFSIENFVRTLTEAHQELNSAPI